MATNDKAIEALEIMRRRVRLLALLQREAVSRFDAGDKLDCHAMTIQGDLAWLIEHGVPVTSEQESPNVPAVWSVPKKWNAEKWLWKLMSAKAAG